MGLSIYKWFSWAQYSRFSSVLRGVVADIKFDCRRHYECSYQGELELLKYPRLVSTLTILVLHISTSIWVDHETHRSVVSICLSLTRDHLNVFFFCWHHSTGQLFQQVVAKDSQGTSCSFYRCRSPVKWNPFYLQRRPSSTPLLITHTTSQVISQAIHHFWYLWFEIIFSHVHNPIFVFCH